MGTNHEEIQCELKKVFRRVFDDDELLIADATTAAEISGWDSIAHLNLIIAIEKRFGVSFTGADLASMRGPGQTVGHLIGLIAAKGGRV